MNIRNQAWIGSTVSAYASPERKGTVGGSGKAAQIDYVNGLITNDEIRAKTLAKVEKSREIRLETIENQVARSKDGDTLQLSPASLSKFEAHKKTMLKGKTETDLLNMVRKGELSRGEYLTEMKKRAASEEKIHPLSAAERLAPQNGAEVSHKSDREKIRTPRGVMAAANL